MREIIFRGKRVDGTWVVGCYVNHLTRMLCPIGDFLKEGDEKHYIVKSGFADWNMPRDLEFVEVIPETVGQYTGLTDKNGNKIFEGDIVKATYDFGPAGEKERIVEVVFGSFGTNLQDWIFKEDGYLPEIIGNIHDNPELLT